MTDELMMLYPITRAEREKVSSITDEYVWTVSIQENRENERLVRVCRTLGSAVIYAKYLRMIGSASSIMVDDDSGKPMYDYLGAVIRKRMLFA